MRKFLKFAFVGAIALTGFGFTSCSSDEDFDETTNLTGEPVKTSFTISIDDVKAPATKQTKAEVQADNAFQGMSEITIFPAMNAITAGTTFTAAKFTLADFTAFTLAGVNAKVYTDVAIPIGTTDFLFYAATGTGNQDNGALNATYSTTDNTTAGITFDLEKIQASKTVTDEQTDGKAVLDALNAVDAAFTAQVAAANAAGTDAAAMKTTLEDAQTAFRYSDGAATPTYTAYAGSSKSVKAMLEDLYNTLKVLAATYATVATYPNAVATAIETYFTATETTAGSGVYTLAWKTDPDFPNTAYALPDGSVAVQFNGTAFAYVATSVDGLAIPAISKYTKPAKLYYTVNTKGMVKDEVYLTETGSTAASKTMWDDPSNPTNTNSITAQYEQKAVSLTTKSVIMKDQVQYAVGRFDVQVRAYNGGNDIEDHNDDPVAVPSPNGYKVTGILVGGQKQVGWDFTPIDGAEELTLYDKTIQSNADGSAIYAKAGTDYSAANSTLVLETKSGTTVNIAVEFENDGEDFIGKDGVLIPAGTKFYLIGQLIPTVAGEVTRDKVFEQDYITTAKLTITDLSNAYNIVPDLRSPRLEFGFSVNLEWKPGNTFTVNFQ